MARLTGEARTLVCAAAEVYIINRSDEATMESAGLAWFVDVGFKRFPNSDHLRDLAFRIARRFGGQP